MNSLICAKFKMNLLIRISLFLIVCFSGQLLGQSAQCISRIEKRLDEINRQDFDLFIAKEIIDDFDFGTLSEIVSDPVKAAAYKRIYSSMSEFLTLAPNDLSGNALKGYTRLSGAIIHTNAPDFVDKLKDVFGGRTQALFDGQGFNDVMEYLESSGSWLNQTDWSSPNGLVYKLQKNAQGDLFNEGHRISHVLSHTVPGYKQGRHSVFSDVRGDVLDVIDSAWINKGTPIVGGNGNLNYDIDMGRVVGTSGETHIRIIVKPNGNEIVTAFPQ